MNTALFRCDGVGMLGHLSRCIALAEALREMGWSVLFRSTLGEVGRALLVKAEFDHLPVQNAAPERDAVDTVAAARAMQAQWIVLDGYDFTASFADGLAGDDLRLAVIDDFAAWPRYPVDVIINPDIGAGSLQYPSGTARLLLGPQYFLARADLQRLRTKPRASRGASRLCIALSGDPTGEKTLTALRGLSREGLHIRVLVADGPNRGPIETIVSASGGESRLRLIPQAISEDLAWADAVLCTGGMIKYESIFLGAFPLVISNTSAEAVDTAHWLNLGVGLNLGLMSDLNGAVVAQALATFTRIDTTQVQNAMARAQALFGDHPSRAAACVLSDSHWAAARAAPRQVPIGTV